MAFSNLDVIFRADHPQCRARQILCGLHGILLSGLNTDAKHLIDRERHIGLCPAMDWGLLRCALAAISGALVPDPKDACRSQMVLNRSRIRGSLLTQNHSSIQL